MSFLSDNHSDFLSARITQKGRNAISKGSFNIEFFQIGDSEFDYNFNTLTGSTTHQKVFSPFDYNTSVKYPIGYDSDLTTTYGIPTQFADSYTIRNVMGPAGFVSGSVTGSTISCPSQVLDHTQISGGTTINVTSGNTFQNCEFVTLVLGNVGDDNIDGNFNSLIYKVTGITGNTIYLDREIPNITSTDITGTVICNRCEIEYPDLESLDPNTLPIPVDTEGQLNPWTLNTVWTTKPIGADVSGTDENLTGYTSNRFVSTKEYLGYTKDSQIFTNLTGGTISGFSSSSYGSGFKNSTGDFVEVKPSEQRCVAIIHYSELGDTIADPERFFKYDDYISHLTLTGDTLAVDYEGDDISDTDYFEVYLPFVQYHRTKCYKKVKVNVLSGGTFTFTDCQGNPRESKTLTVGDNQIISGTTLSNIDTKSITGTSTYNIVDYIEPYFYGTYFTMDTTDYYIKPTTGLTESRFELKFRYLLDEVGNKVGKVFVNNKIIVFDDQELVAILDYRSNRRFTLPAPKVNIVPSDTSAENSLITGNGAQTYWITYMFNNVDGVSSYNYLPCNYFTKVEVNVNTDNCNISYPSNISLKFDDGFNYMKTEFAHLNTGYTAKHMYVLIQSTPSNELPASNAWIKIPITGLTTSFSGYLEPSGLTKNSITITKSMYTTNQSNTFDLETYMTSDYLGNTGSTTQPQFGDEQPFPGSIKLVRATDVEQMNFLVNLPSGKFGDGVGGNGYSQNPTFSSGSVMITEVALLDSGKNPLVIAKSTSPLRRTGTQVFSVKLDF